MKKKRRFFVRGRRRQAARRRGKLGDWRNGDKVQPCSLAPGLFCGSWSTQRYNFAHLGPTKTLQPAIEKLSFHGQESRLAPETRKEKHEIPPFPAAQKFETILPLTESLRNSHSWKLKFLLPSHGLCHDEVACVLAASLGSRDITRQTENSNPKSFVGVPFYHTRDPRLISKSETDQGQDYYATVSRPKPPPSHLVPMRLPQNEQGQANRDPMSSNLRRRKRLSHLVTVLDRCLSRILSVRRSIDRRPRSEVSLGGDPSPR